MVVRATSQRLNSRPTPPAPPPGDAYVLTVTTNPTSTDYDNRHVDVTGTVTKADGAPEHAGTSPSPTSTSTT
jgi:hypothetical protein